MINEKRVKTKDKRQTPLSKMTKDVSPSSSDLKGPLAQTFLSENGRKLESAAMSSPVTPHHLPTEILAYIFEYLDLAELNHCLRACKRLYYILNSKSESGLTQRCWSGFRKRVSLPDPAIFEIKSESVFLEKLFSKNHQCSYCGCSDNCTPPIWQFLGSSFCGACLQKETVILNRLNADQYQYQRYPVFKLSLNEYRDIINDNSVGGPEFCLSFNTVHLFKPAQNPPSLEFGEVRKVACSIIAKIVNGSSMLHDYKCFKYQSYIINVYKWLKFKYPFLDKGLISQLPSLKRELDKKTSLGTATGREQLEQAALKDIHEKRHGFLLERLKQALMKVSRFENESKHWLAYQPFWNDFVLAQPGLVTVDAMIVEIKKNHIAFIKQLNTRYNQIALMLTCANDLPENIVMELMDTDAFKSMQVKEFAEICKQHRTKHQRETNFAKWTSEYSCDTITQIPSLIKEMESDPVYIACNDKSAFAELVSRIKEKQSSFEHDVDNQLRVICRDSDVYVLTSFAANPPNAYRQYLEETLLNGDDGQQQFQLHPCSVFLCRDCSESFTLLDDIIKHVLDSHNEDIKAIQLGREWRKYCDLAFSWVSKMKISSRDFDFREKLFIVRTFANWTKQKKSFELFKSHVELCKLAFKRPRELYDRFEKCIREHGCFVDNLDNEDKEKETKLKFWFDKSLNLDDNALKRTLKQANLDHAYESHVKQLKTLALKCTNPKFMTEMLLKDFNEYFESKRKSLLAISGDKVEPELEDRCCGIELKWTQVDELCSKSPLLDHMWIPGSELVEEKKQSTWVSSPYRYEEDEYEDDDYEEYYDYAEKWRAPIANFSRKRKEQVLKWAKRMAEYCGLPEELVKKHHNRRMFYWKGKEEDTIWKRSSLCDFLREGLPYLQNSDIATFAAHRCLVVGMDRLPGADENDCRN